MSKRYWMIQIQTTEIVHHEGRGDQMPWSGFRLITLQGEGEESLNEKVEELSRRSDVLWISQPEW